MSSSASVVVNTTRSSIPASANPTPSGKPDTVNVAGLLASPYNLLWASIDTVRIVLTGSMNANPLELPPSTNASVIGGLNNVTNVLSVGSKVGIIADTEVSPNTTVSSI